MSNYPSTKQVLLKSLDAVKATVINSLELNQGRGLNPLADFNCDEDTFIKAVGDKIDEAVKLNPAHKIPDDEIKVTLAECFDDILDDSYKIIDKYEKEQYLN